MSLLEIGQKPIVNNDGKIKNLETRVLALETNSAKKNQENTFTTNQKIQGQLEIRQNGSVLKVGNVDNNNSCYMELFNGNDRRAYIGHTSSNNNTFEINNGNNEIKLAGGSVNVNNKKITGVANPTSNSDATNKAYVDGLAQGAAKTNIANTFNANQKIQGQLEIRKNDDAIKLGSTTNNGRCYIELFNENTSIGMIGKTNETNEFKIDVGGNHINLAGGLVKVNNKRITQVANPTENTDAVNKQYVDTKNTEQSNTINNQLNQIQGVIQQQGNRITTLENNTINGKIKYNKTYIFLYEKNKYAEYVNVGGFDITIFRHSLDGYNAILYTNFFAYDRNWFVISGQMYNSNTVEIMVAKKAGTNYSYPVEVNVSRMERINPGEPIAEIQGEQ